MKKLITVMALAAAGCASAPRMSATRDPSFEEKVETLWKERMLRVERTEQMRRAREDAKRTKVVKAAGKDARNSGIEQAQRARDEAARQSAARAAAARRERAEFLKELERRRRESKPAEGGAE